MGTNTESNGSAAVAGAGKRWRNRVAALVAAALIPVGAVQVAATPEAVAAPAVAPAVGGAVDTAVEYSMAPHEVADDPLSKILGATPGPVVKRVGGVWFPSPTAPAEADRLAAQGRALMGPGTPILVGDGDARNVCTLTAAGRDAGGRMIGVTAGHCGGQGAPVRSMDAEEAGVVGTVERVDGTLDYAVIVLNGRAVPTSTYGDTRVVDVAALPGPGEIACKQGIATGRSCGPTWLQDAPGSAAAPHVSTQICAAPGDSGAPVFVGDRLVAMVKGADSAPACTSPLQGPAFAPTVVTSFRAQLDDMNLHTGPGSGFRLA
ncbi:hypothetical protein [uncultured Corynebacterium sp.]|uniref:hypothetical protein n=1 Tax=uncultured Corynebacterium sp. TaxID=159447 RepID=UPI0025EDD743|nr:hypothetical protein [uncultured Corynebacterium sp.]